MIHTRDLAEAFDRVVSHLVAVSDDLSAADRILGDGDLGVTMVRGCATLRPELERLSDDIGEALIQCGTAFTRAGGSSFGTLLSTGLVAAGRACEKRNAIQLDELPSLLRTARDAMLQRGKANLGDKTVVDAVDATATAVDGETDPQMICRRSLAACDEVLETFRSRRSKIGRARVGGERSVGIDDPGMLAWREIIVGICDTDATARQTTGFPNPDPDRQ